MTRTRPYRLKYKLTNLILGLGLTYVACKPTRTQHYVILGQLCQGKIIFNNLFLILTCRVLVLLLVLTPCRFTIWRINSTYDPESQSRCQATPSVTPNAYMPTDHTVPCKARSSLKRLPFTGPCPTIRLSFTILTSRPSVAPSTRQQHGVTCFNCNGSSQKQALGHNDDSQTRRWHDVRTCMPMTPWHTLSRIMIFMRLPAPHLGTTSPINDHPCPPPCRRQRLSRKDYFQQWLGSLLLKQYTHGLDTSYISSKVQNCCEDLANQLMMLMCFVWGVDLSS
jgi:hypothetical protein